MINCALDFRARGVHGITGLTQVAALVSVVAMSFGTSASGATVILDDFESGFSGMQGQLSATGQGGMPPKPDTQFGMRIDSAVQGGCDHLIGSSQALCGSDTKKWAGHDGTVLRYEVDFGTGSGVVFDIAAFSDNDPFDHHSGSDSDVWGDYLRVSSLISGTKTLLAEFTGVMQSERTPDTAFGLASTDAGSMLGKGVFVDATFSTISLFGATEPLKGKGALLFEIRSTGSSEQIGLDNIQIAEVPLPNSLSLSLFGLTGFAAAGKVRGLRGKVAN